MEHQIGYLMLTPDGGWGLLYFSPCPHVQPIESVQSNARELLAELRAKGIPVGLATPVQISWGQALFREEMREAELVPGSWPSKQSRPSLT